MTDSDFETEAMFAPTQIRQRTQHVADYRLRRLGKNSMTLLPQGVDITIGRQPDNDIVCYGKGMSRHHCKVGVNGDGVAVLTILESAKMGASINGEFVNGTVAHLRHADRIGLACDSNENDVLSYAIFELLDANRSNSMDGCKSAIPTTSRQAAAEQKLMFTPVTSGIVNKMDGSADDQVASKPSDGKELGFGLEIVDSDTDDGIVEATPKVAQDNKKTVKLRKCFATKRARKGVQRKNTSYESSESSEEENVFVDRNPAVPCRVQPIRGAAKKMKIDDKSKNTHSECVDVDEGDDCATDIIRSETSAPTEVATQPFQQGIMWHTDEIAFGLLVDAAGARCAAWMSDVGRTRIEVVSVLFVTYSCRKQHVIGGMRTLEFIQRQLRITATATTALIKILNPLDVIGVAKRMILSNGNRQNLKFYGGECGEVRLACRKVEHARQHIGIEFIQLVESPVAAVSGLAESCLIMLLRELETDQEIKKCCNTNDGGEVRPSHWDLRNNKWMVYLLSCNEFISSGTMGRELFPFMAMSRRANVMGRKKGHLFNVLTNVSYGRLNSCKQSMVRMGEDSDKCGKCPKKFIGSIATLLHDIETHNTAQGKCTSCGVVLEFQKLYAHKQVCDDGDVGSVEVSNVMQNSALQQLWLKYAHYKNTYVPMPRNPNREITYDKRKHTPKPPNMTACVYVFPGDHQYGWSDRCPIWYRLDDVNLMRYRLITHNPDFVQFVVTSMVIPVGFIDFESCMELKMTALTGFTGLEAVHIQYFQCPTDIIENIVNVSHRHLPCYPLYIPFSSTDRINDMWENNEVVGTTLLEPSPSTLPGLLDVGAVVA